MSCHDAEALESLVHHWGSAYVIAHPSLDLWLAERRDDHVTLTAQLPSELLDKIRADYGRCPVDAPIRRPEVSGGARSGRGAGWPPA